MGTEIYLIPEDAGERFEFGKTATGFNAALDVLLGESSYFILPSADILAQ